VPKTGLWRFLRTRPSFSLVRLGRDRRSYLIRCVASPRTEPWRTYGIFLSTVSNEFRSYRDRLAEKLKRPNLWVHVQEDFIAAGTEALDKLDDYIRECEAVAHLVGDMTGAMASPSVVAAIKERYPDLATRFPPLAETLSAGAPALSHTQWEAFLALYLRRERIHYDSLGGGTALKPEVKPEAPVRTGLLGDGAVTIRFAKSGVDAQWLRDSGSLLELAEAVGLASVFGCRCGTCAARITASPAARSTM
jgi:hypothetical protein